MAKASLLKETIPNQIFIGCPWKTVRKKYLSITDSLKKKFPIHFVIIGSEVGHSADDLLNFIKAKLESSSGAIFDVTYGNPNVSLEFGFAEGRNIQKRAVYEHPRESRESFDNYFRLGGQAAQRIQKRNVIDSPDDRILQSAPLHY